METTAKKTATKTLTGQALFNHRMAILNRKRRKPLVVELEENVWNLKSRDKSL